MFKFVFSFMQDRVVVKVYKRQSQIVFKFYFICLLATSYLIFLCLNFLSLKWCSKNVYLTGLLGKTNEILQ